MAKTLSSSTTSRVANRFFSTSRAAAPPPPLPSQSNLISHRSSPTLFYTVGSTPNSTSLTVTDQLQRTAIRPRVHRPRESYSRRRSRCKCSDQPPTETAPLPSGCDDKHWLIVIDNPGGVYANKEKMIDCYVQTLAKIVGRKKLRGRSTMFRARSKFAFGCEIDEETSNKLKGIPGVLYVLPDSYVDPEFKDYGGELFVNGEVVPERQRRIVRFTTIEEIPRCNDRTSRNVQRRENML